MRFIVEVLPVAEDRANPAAAEAKFHLKIDDNLSFADVLRLVEERFRTNYATNEDCYFAKLQDEDGVDLLPKDQISDIFDNNTPKANIVAVRSRQTRKRKEHELEDEHGNEGQSAKRPRRDEEGYAIPKIPLQRAPGQLAPTSANRKSNNRNLAQRAANRAALLQAAGGQSEALSGTATSKSSLLTPESHENQAVPTSAQRPPSSLAQTVQSSANTERNVTGPQSGADMAVEDPIEDDDDMFQFNGGNVEDEELLESEARSSATKKGMNAFDRLRSSQEVPPSSVRSRRSRSDRTPNRPWTKDEDEKLRAGMVKNIPTAQILAQFNIDRTASAARGRKKHLQKMSSGTLVASSQLSQDAEGSDKDDGHRTSEAKRLPWAIEDVKKLRQGIANGFTPSELQTWFFTKRSQESVAKKFKSEKDSVYAFEEGKPDWPNDRTLVAGWCPLFNTQLRRGYKSGWTSDVIHEVYFLTFSKDVIRKKYNRYHNQMLRLRFQQAAEANSDNIQPPSSQPTSQPAESSPLITRTTRANGDLASNSLSAHQGSVEADRGAQGSEVAVENTQVHPSSAPAEDDIPSSPPKTVRPVESSRILSSDALLTSEGQSERNQNRLLKFSPSSGQTKLNFTSATSYKGKGKQPLRPPKSSVTDDLERRFPKRPTTSVSSASQNDQTDSIDVAEEFIAGLVDNDDDERMDELVVEETQPNEEEPTPRPTAPPTKSAELSSASSSDDDFDSSSSANSAEELDVFVKDNTNAGAQLSQELETHARKSRSQSETSPVGEEARESTAETTAAQILPKEHEGRVEASLRLECPTRMIENAWDDETQLPRTQPVQSSVESGGHSVDEEAAFQTQDPLTTRSQRICTKGNQPVKPVEHESSLPQCDDPESTPALEPNAPQPISASSSIIQPSEENEKEIRTPASGSSTGKLPRRMVPGSYAAEALRARMASRESLNARQSIPAPVARPHQSPVVAQPAPPSTEESDEKPSALKKIPKTDKDFWEAARHMARKEEDVPSVYKTLKGYHPGILAMLAGEPEEAKAIHRKELRARRDKAVEEGRHPAPRNAQSNQLLGPDDEAADEEIVRDDDEELKAFESDLCDEGPSDYDNDSDASESNPGVDDTRHFSEVEDEDEDNEVTLQAPALPAPDASNDAHSNQVENNEVEDPPKPMPRPVESVVKADLAEKDEVDVFDDDSNFIASRPSSRDGQSSVVPLIVKQAPDGNIDKFDDDSNLVDSEASVHKSPSPEIAADAKEEPESDSDEAESDSEEAESEVEEAATQQMTGLDGHVSESAEEFPGRGNEESTPQYYRRQNARLDRNPMLTDSMLPPWPSSGHVPSSNGGTQTSAVSNAAVDGTQVASLPTQSSGLDLPVIQSAVPTTDLSKSAKKRLAKRRKSEAGSVERPSKKLKQENIKSSSPGLSNKLPAMAPPPIPAQPTKQLNRVVSSDSFQSFTSAEGGSTRSKKSRNIRRTMKRRSSANLTSASTSFDRTLEITDDANEDDEPRSEASKTSAPKSWIATTPFASRTENEPEFKKPTRPSERVTPIGDTQSTQSSGKPVGPVMSPERPTGWLSGLRGMLKTRGSVPKPQALNGTANRKPNRSKILVNETDDDMETDVDN